MIKNQSNWNSDRHRLVLDAVRAARRAIRVRRSNRSSYVDILGLRFPEKHAYDVATRHADEDLGSRASPKPISRGDEQCGDVVLGVLRAGGLHPAANSVGPTVPNWISIGDPNDSGRFNPRFH